MTQVETRPLRNAHLARQSRRVQRPSRRAARDSETILVFGLTILATGVALYDLLLLASAAA